MRFRFLLILFALLLMACGANEAANEETAVSSPTPPSSAAADPTPTQIPATTFQGGQNPDGTFYRGDAAAPITLIEYSDFL